MPDLTVYSVCEEDAATVRGIHTFNLAGLSYSLVAAILGAEYVIVVRHGCYCAHPLSLDVLRIDDRCAQPVREEIRRGLRARVPGAARIRIDIGTRQADIDEVGRALAGTANQKPRRQYRLLDGSGDYLSDPETSPPPTMPFP